MEGRTIWAGGLGPYSDLIRALIMRLSARLDGAERDYRTLYALKQRRQRRCNVIADAPEENSTVFSALLLLPREDGFELLSGFCAEPRPTKRSRQRHDNLPLGFADYSCIFNFMQDLREALQEFIRQRVCTQSDVAREFGVSQPSISRVLQRGSVKPGPAIRKIREGLSRTTSGPEAIRHKPEYSCIQDGGEGLKRITERLRSLPDMEAVALDKMLAALNDFLDEWTGGDA
ncbi:MAG: helix-turn-helix domain-containing protein [Gemmobacter sp.]